MLHQIRLNFGGGVREEMFLGEEYIVLHAVAIQEGVWTGMDGVSVYYSDEELAAAAPTWNHLPIVATHPDPHGPSRGSAMDPDVLNAQEVGLVLNSVHQNSKTEFDLYLNKRRMEEVDERLLERALAGEAIEGSTGIKGTDDPTPGKWGDKEYKVKANELWGDHFALLLDAPGACSVADGCGVAPRLNAAKKCDCHGKCDSCKLDPAVEHWNGRYDEEKRKKAAKDGLALPDGTFPIETGEDVTAAVKALVGARNKTAAKRHIAKRARALGKADLLPPDWTAGQTVRLNNRLALNEQSLSDVMSAVREALYSKFSKPGYSWNGYVEDVYQDFAIYCVYDYSKPYPQSNETYKIGYSLDKNGVVTLSGDPVQVEREVSYVTANSAHVIANASGRFFSQTEVRLMDRKGKIDRLIANGGFEEADRDILDKKTDAQLDKLFGRLTPETPAVPAVTQNAAPPPTVPPVVPATDPRKYIQEMNAPQAYKTMLLNGLEMSLARKGQIITALMAHPANKFTKEFLELKELPELEGMAAIALPADVHANGSGGVQMFQGGTSYFGAQGVSQHLNAADPEPTVGLALPSEAEYDAQHNKA